MQILCFDASFALIRAVLKERIMYGLWLILFILIAAFTVLNMLIGVVCQIVSASSAAEKSASMKARIAELFKLLEVEDSGFISRKELERNKHILMELEKAGVDEDVLKTALSIVDRRLHTDDGHLDMEEFLEVIFKLLHPPHTQDILLVQSKLEKLEKALESSSMYQSNSDSLMFAQTDDEKLLAQQDQVLEAAGGMQK